MKKIRKSFDFSSFLCSLKMRLLLRRWGLMALMLLGLPFVVSAQNQKVTINVKDVDVQVVFKQIKEQTSLNFVYNADQLKVMKAVTLDVKDVTVDAALAKLFEGTAFEYKFEMQSIVIKKKVEQAENKKVTLSGQVTDKSGAPLPGVAVLLRGTTVGTATDMNGNFKFLVPREENTILVFSFIGMKRLEVPAKFDEPMKVKLEEDATELEEVNVISTGYYNVDKRHLTSSVTSLKMDDIMMPGVSTIDQMLEGNVPGMIFMQNSGQVGAAPKLKIRGSTTVLGSQAPLWVLDGVILSDPVNVDPQQINDLDFVNLLGNAISGLNPDDIDRIDVLKDASATAIYGPQASNGVIVITTKKGKVGAPAVSYSVTGTLRRRPHYSDRSVNVMNSKERIDLSRELVDKRLAVANLNSWVGYEAAAYDYFNGVIDHAEFDRRVRDMETCNTDWFDLLLRNSFSHNHSLSISGGAENVRYYASMGYSNENGNIRKEKNDRYTGMAKIDINYKRFNMTFSLNGNLQKKDYTPSEVGVMNYAYNTSRSVRAYDEEGELWFYQRHDLIGTETYDQPFSIINEQNNSYNKIETDQVALTMALGYKLTSWLKADAQFSFNISHSSNDTYYGENTWYAACLRKLKTSTGVIDNNKTLLLSGGELTQDDTKSESYNLRGQLTFNRFLDKENIHQLTATVIGELSSTTYSGFKIVRRGYIPDRGMLFDKVEIGLDEETNRLKYPDYYTWLESDDARGTMKDNLTRKVGLVASASYVYKNSYILNANMRIDASNKFGDASNDRLLPIWSVSGRWNLHENVLKNVRQVNTLALKLSFGYQGNMSAQDSPRLIIKKGTTNEYFGEYESTITQYPNPDLKWEKTSTLNADVEFSLFNNKLNGSIGYYYRHTTDAFLSKTVSFVNGVGQYTVNKGELTNQGYELTLNFVPINTMTSINGQNKGFVWRFDPNFGSVFNQLLDKIKPKDKTIQDEIKYSDYLNGSVQIAGRPLNTFYSYKFKGLSPEDGRPMFYGTEETMMVNGEEVKTRDVYAEMDKEEVFMTVMERSGCREPVLQGSIRNYFGWRNWGLNLNLSYSIGSKVRMLQMYPNGTTAAPGPETNMRREFTRRWQQPGDERYTNIPGLLSSREYQSTLSGYWWSGIPNEFASNIWKMYDNSNLRVASGDYLRLQNVSLRYVVPERLCQKLLLKSAYVSVTGTNLFTLCSKKLKGQDPSQSGSSSLVNLSIRPMYSFQLNVTF